MKNQPLSLRQFEEMLWQQTLERMHHGWIFRKRNEKKIYLLSETCARVSPIGSCLILLTKKALGPSQ